MPKPLKTEGNLASNWKKFKRAWDNYAIVARLNRFEEEFKTATFLSCIGEEAMEIFEGLDFASEDERTKFDIVVKKFQDLCLGETNETYERFLFNSRQKNETETVDQYITALRTLAKTCNFCACLRDSLIRDRLVIGINNNALQKKLLQDRNLTLAKAIDICRSSESTKQQVTKIHANDDQAASEAEINAMFTNANKTQTGRRDGGRGGFERRDGGRDTKIQCKYCGTSHQKKKESCPAFGSRCRNCGRDNHFAKVCMQKRKPRNAPVHGVSEDSSSDSGDSISTVELHPAETISAVHEHEPETHAPRLFVRMQIKGGKSTKFQIDTGATCNVLRKSELKGTKYERRIRPSPHVLKMYNNSTLTPLGKCKIQVRDPTTTKKFKVPFTIVEDHHVKSNLLGCRTVQQLDLIRVKPSTQVNQVSEDVPVPHPLGLKLEDVQETYPDVFEGLGTLGPELHLEVDPNCPPVQLPPRKIPESLKQPLREHLDDLVKRDVIERVNGPTEWVSALVVVAKPNGKIRLCLDPRPLNKALKRCRHPIPTIDDVLPELSNAKVFTKVDCSNGYWQVKLDDESSLLTTFNTPFGRFKWKRMPFGISPAGEIFQQRLDQAIDDLEGVRTVADDILITGNGATLEEATADHDLKIKRLFERCRAKQIKLNSSKIEFKKTSMPYIGHILTPDGVKADPAKVKAILEMKQPSDVAGVRRILGTVNYLAKFLPHLSQVSEPLRQLTKKDHPFVWNEATDTAFSEIKKLITTPPVLKYYEPNEPLVLQCDASDHGLGAALIQGGKPVAFASRALSQAEQKYAQIEKELLAIVYGVERFHQFTYGRPVTVESDHKPLEVIHQKPLSVAPRRLQKMMMRLHHYDVTITYKKGSEMLLADTLSRHHLESCNDEACSIESDFEWTDSLDTINQILACETTTAKLRDETGKDHELQQVKSYIYKGWPGNAKCLTPNITPYFHIRDELTTQDGLVFRGDRIVIPRSLRKQMLLELHSAHQGIESTTRRARDTVYWPHLNQELKDHISRCATCETYSAKQRKEPLIPHEIPTRAWAKVSCDLFELDKKMYLVTVDYYSCFFEVDHLQVSTSQAVIKKLKPHFARYGIPDTLVSDNGPQFISKEFQEFSEKFQFHHVTTSPYHHQSNGKAESAVKQAKRILRTCKASGDDVYLALLAIRNTPQTIHETSPAQRLLNRRTKSTLPVSEKLLQPKINKKVDERIRKRQETQKKYHDRGAKELSTFRPGEMVRLQPTHGNEKKWKRGKILRQVGIRSYEVECKGYTYTRNRKFLRPSRATTFSDDNYSDEEEPDRPGTESAVPTPPTPETNEDDAHPTILAKGHIAESNRGATRTSDATRTRSGRVVKQPSRLGINT